MRSLTIIMVIGLVAFGCGVEERCELRLGETFCDEGVSYYYDTCGNPAGVKQNCQCGCRPDHCQTCDGCFERSRTVCQDGGIYWADSCGHLGALVEQCACGCAPDGLTCLACPGCVPNATTTCQGGVAYWVDSCGNPGEVIEACACGCDPAGVGCAECTCTPDCTGKQCGPDGCGGTCGPVCRADETCRAPAYARGAPKSARVSA